MTVNYNDVEEQLEYYCSECHRGIENPHYDKYCSFCGHKLNPDKVNKVRAKIKKLCFEEGH